MLSAPRAARRPAHNRVPALVTVLCLAAALTPAVAGAASRAGARYDGRSASGQRVFVRVARDGRGLSDYRVAARVRCSDGRERVLALTRRGEAPTIFAADGSFAHASPARPFAGFEADGGTARVQFAGRFDPDGRSAAGTISSTYRGRRFSCSGDRVPFTAYRDGTPRAPFRGSTTASGLYQADAARTQVRLDTLVPAGLVRGARASYRPRCRAGTRLSGSSLFRELPIRRSSFGQRGRGTTRLSRGRVSRSSFSLSGRFTRSGGRYRVRGRWRVSSVVSRNGRRLDTCSLDVPFSGHFVRGPRNDPRP